MSTTPSQAGPGGAGAGAVPKRPAAYPASRPAAAPPASPSPASTKSPTTGAGPSAIAPSPAGGGSKSVTSASISGAAKPGKPDLFSRRNLILGGSAAAALVLLVALLMWRPWSPKPPRLNDQPYKIAQFASSSAMDKLPWAQQREYMDVLAEKDDALRAAYKDGKLDDQQFRRALQLGWYDKHLDRMEKFFNRPPALRVMYIDEKVLGKKVKKKQDHPGAAPTTGPGKAPKPKKEKNPEKSDDLSPLKPEEIDRDDSTEEQDIKKWPADVRTRWTEYRAVLAQRKEFFKEQERLDKEKRKAAAATADAKAGEPKAGDARPGDGKAPDGSAGDSAPSKAESDK